LDFSLSLRSNTYYLAMHFTVLFTLSVKLKLMSTVLKDIAAHDSGKDANHIRSRAYAKTDLSTYLMGIVQCAR